MPVHSRQPVCFQQVHTEAFFGLINGKRLLWLEVVVELSEHEPSVACHQRTGGVAIVACRDRCRRCSVLGARAFMGSSLSMQGVF